MQFHQAKAKPAYNYRYTQALYKKSAHNPTFAASKKLQEPVTAQGRGCYL